MTYLRIVAWDVLGRIAWRLLRVAALFFFSAWVWMMFWGMVSHAARVGPMSYLASMLVVLAVWLIIIPVIVVALRIYKPPEPDLFA